VRVAAHRGRAVARLASGDRAGAAADWDAVLSLSDPADRPRVERERAAALSPGR
jgi:cytochrome c-type biogenesis protein CcmH/NrfG